MSPLKKGDVARWSHVPEGGGYGYASPTVRVLSNPLQGRVSIAATLKDGTEKHLSVKDKNLTKVEG